MSEPNQDRPLPALLNLWPETGRVLGLTRGQTYRAAAHGHLPLMQIGGRNKVIVARLAERIGRPITWADLERNPIT